MTGITKPQTETNGSPRDIPFGEPFVLLACVQPLLFSGDLRFHLEDHLRRQPLTFFSGLGANISGMLLPSGQTGE